MSTRTEIQVVWHGAAEPLERLDPSGSRWGHGGIFTVSSPERAPGPILYRLDGPFTVYAIEDAETGSAHIHCGFGFDADYNALVRELGPSAGLPADGPPWVPPRGEYAINYFRELDRLLRERLERDGYDGWWMGGELVLWNYAKLKPVRC
jgi:hypothetical protein